MGDAWQLGHEQGHESRRGSRPPRLEIRLAMKRAAISKPRGRQANHAGSAPRRRRPRIQSDHSKSGDGGTEQKRCCRVGPDDQVARRRRTGHKPRWAGCLRKGRFRSGRRPASNRPGRSHGDRGDAKASADFPRDRRRRQVGDGRKPRNQRVTIDDLPVQLPKRYRQRRGGRYPVNPLGLGNPAHHLLPRRVRPASALLILNPPA